ncbi:MAG: diaminopimelate dehydrogenase [Oscillospiraceae bacterium]|nr:diaminopimelate dehydrogenase [Oscillospiraceae bacterium]
MKTRIAIFGYGNLGRGVEAAIAQNADLELVAVFTRRDPAALRIRTPGVPVLSAERAPEYRNKIDVLILCGGSATDLPVQTPKYAAMFNVVDSFDTHAKIPAHFAAADAASRAAGTVSLISCGWDPGLFSLARVYADAILPDGKDETFWGRGVSQGHSDAIRRIEGVLDARQYTVPISAAVEAVRRGEQPTLSPRDKHLRECWVVAAEGADKARIEREIKTMPYYFDEYNTTVHFISAEEMARDHAGLPHGGSVLRSGVTGWNKEHRHMVEYSLKLDSNPEFTGSVLAACARAVHRMAREGMCGCKTILDIPPAWLSAHSGEELRAHFL